MHPIDLDDPRTERRLGDRCSLNNIITHDMESSIYLYISTAAPNWRDQEAGWHSVRIDGRHDRLARALVIVSGIIIGQMLLYTSNYSGVHIATW